MNSKNLATIWLIALTLVVSCMAGNLKAQITLDTTYTAQGAWPISG